MLGEDFRDVSPGLLPRTLEEMRLGRVHNELMERERLDRQRFADHQEDRLDTGPSLEDTIDQLFESATLEDVRAAPDSLGSTSAETRAVAASRRRASSNIHGQVMAATGPRNREYQARRIAALRRELHRMRNGIERVISGLRELGEEVPDQTGATDRLSELGRTLDTISGASAGEEAEAVAGSVNRPAETIGVSNSRSDRTLAGLQLRVDDARRQSNDAQRIRDLAAAEFDVADRELRSAQSQLRHCQNEQRTAENYIRLFGSREEILAQGDSYESPIGGMFTRAWERFRVAEDVRREERNLRHMLDEEMRIGTASDADVAEHLAELGTRDRDVWGMPATTAQADVHLQSTPNVDSPLRLGERLISPSDNDNDSSLFAHPADVRGTRDDTELRDEEVRLEEHYTLLRRQNWSQLDSLGSGLHHPPVGTEASGVGQPGDNTHELDNLSEATVALRVDYHSAHAENIAGRTIDAGLPRHSVDNNLVANNDRGLDAQYVLSVLIDNTNLRENIASLRSQQVTQQLLQDVINNTLSRMDGRLIESILSDEHIIWTTNLPSVRIRRRRARGEPMAFTEEASSMLNATTADVHNIEIMAECFQMSAQLRELSGLSTPEQLTMLSRLQQGERSESLRTVLARMVANDSAMSIAKRTCEQQQATGANIEQDARRDELNRQRRDAARQGDHSRAELDAQRSATRAFALAAGRTAMQAGPAALLAQMTSRDEETRAAYQHLRENPYTPPPDEMGARRTLRERIYRSLPPGDFTASPSATDSDLDSEDGGARGLDARDSGRPEQPMTDEEMTMKLECRICYTQMATIATIPCGHLTMCQWCSEQHSPTMAHDKTRPRRAANCPVCRKGIRQKVRVIRA